MARLLPDSRRSSEEIAISILQKAAERPTTRMSIIANVFITYETATGHLEKLIKQGLIDYNPGTETYRITNKGKQVIMEKRNSDFS